MNCLVCLDWISEPERKENFPSRSGQHHSEPSPISTALRYVIRDTAITQRSAGINPNCNNGEAPPQSDCSRMLGLGSV